MAPGDAAFQQPRAEAGPRVGEVGRRDGDALQRRRVAGPVVPAHPAAVQARGNSGPHRARGAAAQSRHERAGEIPQRATLTGDARDTGCVQAGGCRQPERDAEGAGHRVEWRRQRAALLHGREVRRRATGRPYAGAHVATAGPAPSERPSAPAAEPLAAGGRVSARAGPHAAALRVLLHGRLRTWHRAGDLDQRH